MLSDRSPRKTTSPWRTRETEDTQQAVADDLGVKQPTVSRAIEELPADVKRIQLNKLSTDEKREQVRGFVEDTPTA